MLHRNIALPAMHHCEACYLTQARIARQFTAGHDASSHICILSGSLVADLRILDSVSCSARALTCLE